MIEAIITGILAGFIAAKLTGGEGKGCWIDLFLGLVGGVVGNWLLGLLGISWQPSWFSRVLFPLPEQPRTTTFFII